MSLLLSVQKTLSEKAGFGVRGRWGKDGGADCREVYSTKRDLYMPSPEVGNKEV